MSLLLFILLGEFCCGIIWIKFIVLLVIVILRASFGCSCREFVIVKACSMLTGVKWLFVWVLSFFLELTWAESSSYWTKVSWLITAQELLETKRRHFATITYHRDRLDMIIILFNINLGKVFVLHSLPNFFLHSLEGVNLLNLQLGFRSLQCELSWLNLLWLLSFSFILYHLYLIISPLDVVFIFLIHVLESNFHLCHLFELNLCHIFQYLLNLILICCL